MKKTIAKIIVIFTLLFCYCTIESFYLDMFVGDMAGKIADFKNSAQNESDYLFMEILSYFDENKGMLSVMISRKEVEKIHIYLRKIQDQIGFEGLTAAKVTAGELASMLSEIKK